MEYNIYCDESCHLEHDKSDVMVLGGIYCDSEFVREFNQGIINLKVQFGLKPKDELKWTKISPSNEDLFLSVIDYFFLNEKMFFRGYVARGKSDLEFNDRNGYNDWYYKIYYRMLEFIIDNNRHAAFNLYLDIKDTIGSEKISILKDYLNNHYHQVVVKKAQLVHSDHIAILQLTDILIGAISYKNRGLETSTAKNNVIKRIEDYSGYSLLSTVPIYAKKANWFIWTPDTWR